MTEITTAILLFGIVLAVGIWMHRWQYRAADARLKVWAQRSNLQVLDKQPANPIGTGPAAARSSNKQIMYRVVLADSNGMTHRAIVKIGSQRMGVLDDELEVEWDTGD